MPGSIRVSVLEAVDLPEALIDGAAEKDVTVKVVLGQREYKTEPANVDGGKTAPWNSDFAFPVTNLRDKLIVAVCNNEDQNVTQTAIEIPSIIEKGFRDEFVLLKGGGQIHLKLSFVLTDEERKKIEMMRVAALKRREEALKKRREEERLKQTVVFQTLQPTSLENNPKPPSHVIITEIDDTPTDGKEQASKENASAVPLGFGPTAKPLKPKPLFDYAKAVGAKPGRNTKRKTERAITTGVSPPSTKIVKTDNAKIHTSKQANGQNSTRTLATERQPGSRAGQSPPATSSHENISTSVPPSLQGPYVGRVAPGIVKARVTALEGTVPQEVEGSTLPATELQEEKWQVEGQRARDMLEAEASAMADSLREREDEPRGKRRVNLNNVNLKQHLQRLEGEVRSRSRAGNGQRELGTRETSNKTHNPQKVYKRSPGQPISVSELHQLVTSEIQEEAMKQMESHKDFPSKVWQALSAVADEQNCRPGQMYRSESRLVGPEARWAHKTNLESRWASPEKARRMVRDEWSGQIADPFRARAKILELFKAAAGSNESFCDDQSFQHHSLAGSIGVVVNKVVGGAAMLLAALFMLWPLGEGPSDRGDTPFGDDR